MGIEHCKQPRDFRQLSMYVCMCMRAQCVYVYVRVRVCGNCEREW